MNLREVVIKVCWCLTAGWALLTFAPFGVADQAVLTPSKDNTLYEHPSSNLSNGAGEALFIGRVADDGFTRLRRALLAFDLTSIPPGSNIESVELALYNNRVAFNFTPTGGTAKAHKLTADWGEAGSNAPGGKGGGTTAAAGDATWFFRFFNTMAWVSNGGDFEPVESGTAGYSASAPETITFSSTPSMIADVQMWVDNPAQNFGWIIIGNESADASAQRIASSESGSDPVPVLTVDYTIAQRPRATIAVSKTYDDSNSGEVDVLLDCNSGLIPDQNQNAAPASPVKFVMVDFETGTLDCRVTEAVPAGYQAWYRAAGAAAEEGSVVWNQQGCVFAGIEDGEALTCEVENRLIPISFDVRKIWIDEHPQFNNPTYARARAECTGEAVLSADPVTDADAVLTFDGADSYDSFLVYPHWNGLTECTVAEQIRDSSVDSDDSDCYRVSVQLADDVQPADGQFECTITNTRIYEGIPAINRVGAFILLLSMAVIGLAMLRRTV